MNRSYPHPVNQKTHFKAINKLSSSKCKTVLPLLYFFFCGFYKFYKFFHCNRRKREMKLINLSGIVTEEKEK